MLFSSPYLQFLLFEESITQCAEVVRLITFSDKKVGVAFEVILVHSCLNSIWASDAAALWWWRLPWLHWPQSLLPQSHCTNSSPTIWQDFTSPQLLKDISVYSLWNQSLHTSSHNWAKASLNLKSCVYTCDLTRYFFLGRYLKYLCMYNKIFRQTVKVVKLHL